MELQWVASCLLGVFSGLYRTQFVSPFIRRYKRSVTDAREYIRRFRGEAHLRDGARPKFTKILHPGSHEWLKQASWSLEPRTLEPLKHVDTIVKASNVFLQRDARRDTLAAATLERLKTSSGASGDQRAKWVLCKSSIAVPALSYVAICYAFPAEAMTESLGWDFYIARFAALGAWYHGNLMNDGDVPSQAHIAKSDHQPEVQPVKRSVNSSLIPFNLLLASYPLFYSSIMPLDCFLSSLAMVTNLSALRLRTAQYAAAVSSKHNSTTAAGAAVPEALAHHLSSPALADAPGGAADFVAAVAHIGTEPSAPAASSASSETDVAALERRAARLSWGLIAVKDLPRDWKLQGYRRLSNLWPDAGPAWPIRAPTVATGHADEQPGSDAADGVMLLEVATHALHADAMHTLDLLLEARPYTAARVHFHKGLLAYKAAQCLDDLAGLASQLPRVRSRRAWCNIALWALNIVSALGRGSTHASQLLQGTASLATAQRDARSDVLRQFASAEPHLLESLLLEPIWSLEQRARIFEAFARVQDALGQHELALDSIRRASELCPNNVQLLEDMQSLSEGLVVKHGRRPEWTSLARHAYLRKQELQAISSTGKDDRYAVKSP